MAENRIKKNTWKNIIFLMKLKKINIRRWSDIVSYDNLLFEIGWEISEIFDFGHLLGSGCTKNYFFALKRETVHQDPPFEPWNTSVQSISPNPPPNQERVVIADHI